MALEFVPRKQLMDRLEKGYRLIPGHEYRPGDYAILMSEPVSPEPLTAEQIAAMVARIEPPSECLRRQRAEYKERMCARVSA